MKIAEIMSVDVALASPEQSLKQAADIMLSKDVGSLPVGSNGKLVGMLTDRDIVIRGVAQGLGADARVSEAMNGQVRYCYQDQDVDEVARNMAELQLRRMPVVNREKDLVGIVSLADFAHSGQNASAEDLMKGVAVPHH
ncbi:CBS domain-containing protein [Pseudoxanthomonas dokdonensis]|uniref:Inosine-5-monophosphate dehydrogenase n=1 Tax=Pseudoxanthomonas dokdonensis TaxID=344882 RepID=A0A0R0D083_9GAMM|nr:CBS domain-containing protein [Pseudoxanthomonas dokdonensis]KRG71537.1 inosine-5-monophosphate dehydrogenase [Pseudoxanthomonas dokdonensis]